MNMRTIGIAVIVVALVAAFTGIASATPTEAISLVEGANETKNVTVGANTTAIGGYVTEINITISQQTTKWQGYYGNVSGGIVLMDATGNSMFNWDIDEPTGEVYATPLGTLPDWTNYNNTVNTTKVSVAFDLGTSVTGVADNATDTFNATAHTEFYLAGMRIPGSIGPCATTRDGSGASTWETVLLTDGDAGTAMTDFLFIGLIQESGTSFKGATDPCDYQMIVPDDPNDDGAATTYYFYVEVT